jgi:hypothetical protein
MEVRDLNHIYFMASTNFYKLNISCLCNISDSYGGELKMPALWDTAPCSLV